MRFRPGRPFRRPGPFRMGPALFGRRRAGGGVAAELLAELDRAHRLLAEGQPAEAAPVFARLAGEAEARNMPQRAAQMHLQAARCYFQSRDAASGLSHARLGLGLLKNAGMQDKVGNIYARLLAGLRNHGFNAEADALQTEFGSQWGGGGVASPASPRASAAAQPRGQLPAQCPSCNGPIRSDEVDWIDANTAECPYCGNTLQAA